MSRRRTLDGLCLMTVLCADSEVQPVINTGTLYG